MDLTLLSPISVMQITPAELDIWHMRRTLELAREGEGRVEPNPMVGCVIARGAEIIAEGRHRQFGGPHAEVEALRMAGERARGADMFVSLEPCCHFGKTPPCSQAVIQSGVRRVVIAQRDPFPRVAGGGIAELQEADVEVVCGVLEAEAKKLNAPYLKLVERGTPWIIAKWAMSLDGKMATRSGDSRWISNERSREIVHRLRGRVDAIVVGVGTALVDDPTLTARPKGPRTPLRIVLDSRAKLPLGSKLVQTIGEAPVLVAVGAEADSTACDKLRAAGCEVFICEGTSSSERLLSLWKELGKRRLTNVLVEGGGKILGSLFDAAMIDEVHAFIAPKVIGGASAVVPCAGLGFEKMSQALSLEDVVTETLDGDVYVRGRVYR